MTTNRTGEWLARLSDPAGPNDRYTPLAFAAADFQGLQNLVDLAGRHNVRPALARNLKAQLATAPDAMLSGDEPARSEAVMQILAYADELRLADFARTVLLADVAADIVGRIETDGVPAVLVKGADFAQHAYGGLQLRSFSDIDLLVRPDAENDLGAILGDFGFEAVPPPARRIDHTERAWIRRDDFGGTTLVEIHTDMVHGPELRSRQTLTYDLYADPEAGGVTPAARLVLAGLHGSTSHLFGRLQYVVDGLMIARSGADPVELAERAFRSNATLSVATMLRLAAEIYDCAASRDLLERLGPVPWGKLERRLITAPMVLSAKDANRWRLLPQRYLYRGLLRCIGAP